MMIEERMPLLEAILTEWKTTIGDDYPGYKNHIYRMIHFAWHYESAMRKNRQRS